MRTVKYKKRWKVNGKYRYSYYEKKDRGKKSPKLTVKTKATYYDPKKDWKDNGIKSRVFKDWFGDWEADTVHASKVVDTTGEPEKQYNTTLIQPTKMYHGTSMGGFDEFKDTGSDIGKLLYGAGFYFTENREVAQTYQNQNKPDAFMGETIEDDKSQLFEVYLNIRKPFDLDQDTIAGDKIGLDPNIQYTYSQALTSMYVADYHKPGKGVGVKYNPYKDKLTVAIQAEGYDGMTHIGGKFVNINNPEHRVWITFDASNIKSTENEGSFSASANIYKSITLEKSRRMNIGTVSKGRKKVAEGKWVPVKKDKVSKKSDIAKLFTSMMHLEYDKRPANPPLVGKVFRVMSREEWQSIEAGNYSGAFWSSDPSEIVNFAVGDKDMVIAVAKQGGSKKYKGRTKQYHDLDMKELKDIETLLVHTGTSYAGAFEEVPFKKPLEKHMQANVGEIREWADGTYHKKMANGKWKNLPQGNPRKEDKAKIAKVKLEIATGRRNTLGEKVDYEDAVANTPVGYVIGGLLENNYKVHDFEDLSALVKKSPRDKLSEIFKDIKDSVDVMDLPVGDKKFHVDMFGRALLKLKQIHDPKKVKLTVPVKTKTGKVRGEYIKKQHSIPALALKYANEKTGNWKGRAIPNAIETKELKKKRLLKVTYGKIDPKKPWGLQQKITQVTVPFKVDETGITVLLRQSRKGKERTYRIAEAELMIPYAYAEKFLRKNIKSVRTQNSLVGQLHRSKGYRKTILKEDVK